MMNMVENYEMELFDKYNHEEWENDSQFKKQADILDESDVRRKSDHIAFDKIWDGKTYHHTGYEVWIGQWLYEYYCPETKETTYA